MKIKWIKIHRIVGLIVLLNLALIIFSGILLQVSKLSDNAEKRPQKTISLSMYEDQILKLKNDNINHLLAIYTNDDKNQIITRVSTDLKNNSFKNSKKIITSLNKDINNSGPLQSHTPFDLMSRNDLLDLHVKFALGSFGKYFNMLSSLFYITLLVSSLYLVFNIKFKHIKIKNSYNLTRIIHEYSGLIALPLIIATFISGSYLLFDDLLIKYFLNKTIKDHQININKELVISNSDIKMYFDNLRNNEMTKDITFISFPGHEYSIPNHITTVIEGEEKNIYIYDIATNKGKRIHFPGYLQLSDILLKIHSGEIFNNFGVITYLFLASFLSISLLSAPLLFLKRKKYIKNYIFSKNKKEIMSNI